MTRQDLIEILQIVIQGLNHIVNGFRNKVERLKHDK